jgi:antitoxin component HigA of HigAB toxin-antitoxin module
MVSSYNHKLGEDMEATKAYNPEKAALLIRAAMGMRGIKQTDLAKKLGLNRVVLNMFLNRKLDLLQDDIKRVVNELKIERYEKVLSAPANIDTEL